MEFHIPNCTCSVCNRRKSVIEQHFGQRVQYGRRQQGIRRHDHHAMVDAAWNDKIHQMVETTFRKCKSILLQPASIEALSPEAEVQRYRLGGDSVFEPFNDEVLREMTSNPGREAYSGPTWRPHKGQSLRRIFSEDSIEVLDDLYISHNVFQEELVSICQQTAPLNEKFQSIEKKIQKINFQHRQLIKQNNLDVIAVRHTSAGLPRKIILPKNAPWDLYLQKINFSFRDFFAKHIKLEIKRLNVLNRENSITRFMNIGPDMPRYLAEAMADEMISEQEAAEIFRNGWHRNDVSSEVLAAFLRSKTPVKNNNEQSLILDFQTAQWLHAHHEHDSLILAILRSEMDMEAARELLNSDFRNHPNATNAIVAGNPIETVAMMYGIISQPIESEEETSPSLPLQQVNEDTSSSQKNMEWAREFDV